MTLKNAFIASSLAVALGFGGAALLTATSTYAYDETSTSAINVDEQRVILKGYDTVSYFQGAPAEGNSRFAVEHDGAVYHFANASNAARFAANPEAFAPQFGGHCAWAMSRGYLAPGDPLPTVRALAAHRAGHLRRDAAEGCGARGQPL